MNLINFYSKNEYVAINLEFVVAVREHRSNPGETGIFMAGGEQITVQHEFAYVLNKFSEAIAKNNK